jgi:ferric-dicitrate binding protein FerR (iron transport regulator)
VTKQEFFDLLDRYHAGKTSASENDLLLQIYQHMEDKYALDNDELKALDELEDKLVQRLAGALQTDTNHTSVPETKTRWILPFYKKIVGIAASLLLVAGVLAFYFATRQPGVENVAFLSTGKPGTRITHINHKAIREKIFFADRSYVELESGSSIMYDRLFPGNKREVYFQGKGFFQVTKDHAKPFIVYTDRLVTKVLGTSFEVNSSGTSATASVTVVTGRVAVFRRQDFKPVNAGANLDGGVLITPNHAVLLTVKNEVKKALAPKPAVVAEQQNVSFDFDNTPIASVFDRLEKAYAIKIIFDREKLRQCSLSVNMGNEGFFEKLDLICHTLNLSYQVQGGDVYVTGTGCAD